MSYEYVYGKTNGESRRKRIFLRRVRNFLLLVIFFVIILLIFLEGFARLNKKNVGIISPLADSFVNTSVSVIKNIINPSHLQSVVEDSLKGTHGTYAVTIKNLKTGESYSLKENRKFISASLYKLWVMAVAFNQIESGRLYGGKPIEKEISILNDTFNIATDSAELNDGIFSMTVKDSLNQMITISHNYAALALLQEVGVSNITSFLKQQGLKDSNIGNPPSTTAQDIELFFEKLYTGQLAGPSFTKQMIDLLKNQQINDRIPKYLPNDITVAHKTGELDSFKHDAGIVFTKKGDYVIVIFSESNNPDGASEIEAVLSKNIYNYFQNR